MPGEQVIQPAQFGNEIRRGAPVQAGATVDVDAFRREPLDTTGETEAATHAGERTQPVAQE